MSKRMAIYCRISLDRNDRSESPDRQEARCRKAITERGWSVAEVFTDRDKSAYKRVQRPAYDSMMRGIEDGRFDGVAVWKLDRLTRRFTETGAILEALQRRNAVLLSVEDSFDTSSPIGQALMGLLVAQAETESQNTSLRVRAAWDAAANAGKPHVGGSRCFGFNRDYSVNETEAEVGRRIVDEFIAGTSLNQIARSLNDEGVKTASGKRWYASTVRQWMCSPRIAGLRKHGDELRPGQWEGLISERLWIKVMSEVAKNRLPAARAGERSHLMTGIFFCGACGGKLRHARFRMANGKVLARYQCVKRAGYDSCGSLAVTKEPVDRLVTDEAIALLARGRVPTEAGQSEQSLKDLIDADKVAAAELTRDAFVNRSISRAQLHVLLSELEARIDANERELVRRQTAPDVPSLPTSVDGLVAWFEGASVADARTAVRLVISEVILLPAARRGGNSFDPSRIEIRRA